MAKTRPPADPRAAEIWKERFFALFFQRAYREALPWGEKLVRAFPESASHLGNLATCHLLAGDPARAQVLYRRAWRLDPREMNVLDGMAQACGDLGQLDEAREFGLKSLALKDELFSPAALPPLLAEDRSPPGALYVVSFSLFGDSPRYCETAILNIEAARQIFPGWLCRFYVDATVPEHVTRRIAERGGQVVTVGEADRAVIPGLMWRFLALEDPLVRRVAFRDADSLISERERGPVEGWLASGKSFHVMRDYHTHTELILAGMWGAMAWPLRDIRARMLDYLCAGCHPTHVDQHFLRSRIWPLIRDDQLGHDRIFGFRGALPLPEVVRDENGYALTIGSDYGSKAMGAPCDLPDGSRIEWSIVEAMGGRLLCAYRAAVEDGSWSARIPLNLADGIRDGRYLVRVRPADPHPDGAGGAEKPA